MANSQHGLTKEAAAKAVKDSYADKWATAFIQELRKGRKPLFTPETFGRKK